MGNIKERIAEIREQIDMLEDELYQLKEQQKAYYVVEYELNDYDSLHILRLGFCTEKEAEEETKKYAFMYISEYRQISKKANNLYYEYGKLKKAKQSLDMLWPKPEYKEIQKQIEVFQEEVFEKLIIEDPKMKYRVIDIDPED